MPQTAPGPQKPPRPGPLTRGIGITRRALVLIVVVAALALAYVSSLRIYFSQQHELAQVQAEIEQRQRHIDELTDEVQRWKDPEYVKAQARSRLGWVVPGETGYRVIGADGQPLGGGAQLDGPDDADANLVWWQRLWGSVKVADNPVPQGATTPRAPAPSAHPSPSASPSR